MFKKIGFNISSLPQEEVEGFLLNFLDDRSVPFVKLRVINERREVWTRGSWDSLQQKVIPDSTEDRVMQPYGNTETSVRLRIPGARYPEVTAVTRFEGLWAQAEITHVSIEGRREETSLAVTFSDSVFFEALSQELSIVQMGDGATKKRELCRQLLERFQGWGVERTSDVQFADSNIRLVRMSELTHHYCETGEADISALLKLFDTTAKSAREINCFPLDQVGGGVEPYEPEATLFFVVPDYSGKKTAELLKAALQRRAHEETDLPREGE